MKSLIILPGWTSIESLRKAIPSDSDLLALTPLAMLCLQEAGQPYRTLDDFYPVQPYRKRIDEMNVIVEEVFEELDRSCEERIGFKEPFRSNIFNFIRLFEELLYLQVSCERMREEYRDFCIVGKRNKSQIDWQITSYEDIRRMDYAVGFQTQVSLLQHLLAAKELDVSHAENSQERPPLQILIKNRLLKYTFKIKEQLRMINEIPAKAWLPFLSPSKEQSPCIFIVQSGFDLTYLLRSLHNFRHIYPVTNVENKVLSMPPVNIPFDAIKQRVTILFEKYLPDFKRHLVSLFRAYTTEVVARVPAFKSEIERMYNRYNPKAVFYAAGAYSLIECLFAYSANNRNIPVYYFQHGGSTLFLPRNYHQYMERKGTIRKTLFLNGHAESEVARNSTTECATVGSIKFYNAIKRQPRNRTNGILYCCGPFNFFNYRMLGFNMSDTTLFSTNKAILECSGKENIPLDIKLHPIEEKLSYVYFSELIKHQNPNANIIYGVPAESLMPKYGLIILDYLASAIVPFALGLDTPVVLFLEDSSLINQQVFSVIHDRCYVVHDEEELSEILHRFKNGDLPTKFTDEILNQYVFPPTKGNPLHNIVTHISAQIGG